jgi:hypothetical protein
MSRLKNFTENEVRVNNTTFKVKELETFMKKWSVISKDCKPIIDVYKKNPDSYLYRGDSRARDFIVKKVRKDRYPKDTPQDWHEAFDDALKDNFGWNARSEGLFCTADTAMSGGYGNALYVVFPKGKFDYIYSREIKDLYAHIEGNEGQYMDPSWELRREWEENYGDEFGEDSYNGEWTYEGYSYGTLGSDKDEAVDSVYQDEFDDEISELATWEEDLEELSTEEIANAYGWTPNELLKNISARKDELEQGKDSISMNIEWEPEITLDDYLENMEEEWRNEGGDSDAIYDAARTIIDNGDYVDKNLPDYFKNYPKYEIMVDCDQWYGILRVYVPLIAHMLEHNVDPRQLEFDFMKKRKGSS